MKQELFSHLLMITFSVFALVPMHKPILRKPGQKKLPKNGLIKKSGWEA
jgi:hypothetical protein